MKKIFFCLILFSTSLFVTAQSNYDVQHYKYGIQLNDNNDTIYCSAEVSVKFLEPSSSVIFDLALLNKTGKGMLVDSVYGTDILGFSKGEQNILIVTKKKYKTGDAATFTILYHGIPADGLIISKNKYNHRTFFADNWPNRAHNWILCKDDPADKASVEFIVTAPSHYKVVSNGVLQNETVSGNNKITHWKEDVLLPTKVMVIGVADFAVDTSGIVNGIPVTSWVFSEKSKEGFADYAEAKDILPFFINYIGPYGYKKLANIQSKTIFGGMENASAIFYFENSVNGAQKNTDLLAHEIAHQWFGDMATEKAFSHLWLSEGFATYMTNIYIEAKNGKTAMDKRLQKDRKEVIDFVKQTNRPVVDSVSPLMELLNANSYQKGGWVLHMLRHELGDTVFHSIIKKYYDHYKGSNADTYDLLAVAEEVSKKDLHQFFKQWLFTPGVPQLNIAWQYHTKTKKISITVKQKQQQGAFTFPLDIALQTKKGVVKKNISITKTEETFTLPVKDVVNNIEADPDTYLLFEGTVEKMK